MPRPLGFLRTAARCALLLFLARPATAHELGTIQVRATFLKQGAYQVDVIVDTEQIPSLAVRPFPAADAALADRGTRERQRVESFLAGLMDRSSVRFDGRAVQPEKIEVQADSGPLLTLRLSGQIPARVKTFQWANEIRLGSYLASFHNQGDESVHREWLDNDKPASAPFELRKEVLPLSRREVVQLYLKLGYTHIVPEGTDHILFVLGIFLLSRKLKEVLIQVTAFTVAHTITLGLTIYGLVSLSPAIVEPAIALSIVYVAVENVLTTRLSPWRVAVVFGFGLLHGMGFAGVLREVGLPRSEFLTGLFSFNLGVEAGQLTVILAAYLLVGLAWNAKPWYRRRIVVPASATIALIGLYWAVQRTLF